MIEICRASKDDIEDLMDIRLEMLRIVNSIPDDVPFDEKLIECSRGYFLIGDQTTVFAKDGDKIVGCASISYVTVMPTYDHPTGKRAHLMNVYVKKEYRRKKIADKMCSILIAEAKSKGVTEISLDSTDAGRPLYASLGFSQNDAGMILSL